MFSNQSKQVDTKRLTAFVSTQTR